MGSDFAKNVKQSDFLVFANNNCPVAWSQTHDMILTELLTTTKVEIENITEDIGSVVLPKLSSISEKVQHKTAFF